MEGDISFCVQDSDIDRVVNQFTSDYNGVIEVGVYLGNFHTQKHNKVIVKHEDISIFVYIDRYFFVAIAQEFLNQEEMELFDEEKYIPLTLDEFGAFVE